MNDKPLSVEEARRRMLNQALPLTDTETIGLEAALGRVLAQPLISGVAVPPLDNSAMDGYALRLADLAGGQPLPVGQRIPAGRVGQPLAPGEAARIFTGAPIPPGADAVVMQEDCQVEDHQVRVLKPPKPGENIRPAGEDIQPGQAVLETGDRLGPARLGVAASVGATGLTVFRRLKVAVFFTGDELALPGQPLVPGQIYNSNRASLTGLLRQLGCDVLDLGQVADTLDATLAALDQARATADVVLTSGGVSVGEEDHVRNAVQQRGRIEMWKVQMKPGKPLAYGRLAGPRGGEVDFIGLPGNPVSAFVVFCLFARPFLLRRMGARTDGIPTSFPVPLAADLPRPGKRREFLRARLVDGKAELYPRQGSGVLTSLGWADGLVDIEAGLTPRAGESVAFLPLAELLN